MIGSVFCTRKRHLTAEEARTQPSHFLNRSQSRVIGATKNSQPGILETWKSLLLKKTQAAACDWKMSALLPALNEGMTGCGRSEEGGMGELGAEGLETDSLIQLSPLPLRCVSRTIGAHE